MIKHIRRYDIDNIFYTNNLVNFKNLTSSKVKCAFILEQMEKYLSQLGITIVVQKQLYHCITDHCLLGVVRWID